MEKALGVQSVNSQKISIPFVNLGLQFDALESEILAAIKELSHSGNYILGSTVERFEKNFAKYCGTKYAVAVANGTDALWLPLVALGIGPGDEVITAPNSFIASAGAIVQVGASIRFADVGEDYNLDPASVERAITPRTKAILPVHLTGMPADMKGLMALAEKHRLHIIEDCAQAIGAEYFGKRVGGFGIAGGFSLHPLKNLGVHGDGGVITTSDDEMYAKLLKLRNHGLKNRDECEFFAFNSRLDSIQAAIADIKLKYLDAYTERFREIAKFYRQELEGLVKLPVEPTGRMGVYHNFVFQTPRREELREFMLKHGVETKIHYPIPIHLQAAAKGLGYKRGDFPVAEKQIEQIVSLPIYPELTDAQMRMVTQTVQAFFK